MTSLIDDYLCICPWLLTFQCDFYVVTNSSVVVLAFHSRLLMSTCSKTFICIKASHNRHDYPSFLSARDEEHGFVLWSYVQFHFQNPLSKSGVIMYILRVQCPSQHCCIDMLGIWIVLWLHWVFCRILSNTRCIRSYGHVLDFILLQVQLGLPRDSELLWSIRLLLGLIPILWWLLLCVVRIRVLCSIQGPHSCVNVVREFWDVVVLGWVIWMKDVSVLPYQPGDLGLQGFMAVISLDWFVKYLLLVFGVVKLDDFAGVPWS